MLSRYEIGEIRRKTKLEMSATRYGFIPCSSTNNRYVYKVQCVHCGHKLAAKNLAWQFKHSWKHEKAADTSTDMVCELSCPNAFDLSALSVDSLSIEPGVKFSVDKSKSYMVNLDSLDEQLNNGEHTMSKVHGIKNLGDWDEITYCGLHLDACIDVLFNYDNTQITCKRCQSSFHPTEQKVEKPFDWLPDDSAMSVDDSSVSPSVKYLVPDTTFYCHCESPKVFQTGACEGLCEEPIGSDNTEFDYEVYDNLSWASKWTRYNTSAMIESALSIAIASKKFLLTSRNHIW